MGASGSVAPTSLADGIGLLPAGARLLAAERTLWPLALAPVALSLLAFGAALTLVVANAGWLYGVATDWMPVLEATRWYAWLWIGPAQLLLGALGVVLFAALAGLCAVVAYIVASLLAAPFLDRLAAKTEQLRTGGLVDHTGSGRDMLANAVRSLVEEARRVGFFVAVVGPLSLVGFAVPGAQLVTGPAILLFSVLFLPLDYASYTLDRRLLSFREKRQWLARHRPVALGFGLAGFGTLLVPGLNFAAMPILVVGGTLFCLGCPAETSARAAAAVAAAGGEGTTVQSSES